MTAIAAFSVNNRPVLVGDLLLSGPEREGTPTPWIPSHGPVTNFFPTGSGYTILSLKQKIVLFRETLAIAWAGSYLGARIAVSQLLESIGNRPITPDLIRHLLRDIDSEAVKLGISMIVICLSGDRYRLFDYNCDVSQETADFGRLLASGTGAQHIGRWCNAGAAQKCAEEDVAINLAAHLLGQEASGGSNLREYFGGGYEMACIGDKGFRKIDNITFIIWHATEKSGSIQLIDDDPVSIAKYRYIGEFLIIRSLIFFQRSEDKLSVSDAIHIAHPLIRQTFQDAITLRSEDIDLDSQYTCDILIVDRGEGRATCLSHMQNRALTQKQLVRCHGVGNSMDLTVDKYARDYLVAMATNNK